MNPSAHRKASYQETTSHLPAKALGGSHEAPRLKPADELLLDWSMTWPASKRSPNIGLYHDRMGVHCTRVCAQRTLPQQRSPARLKNTGPSIKRKLRNWSKAKLPAMVWELQRVG